MNDSKPTIAQKSPFVLTTEPGTYWWCACGKSQNQPFCDGSHKTTEFEPIQVDVSEKRNIAWCGCKLSNKQMFCDGTHKSL